MTVTMLVFFVVGIVFGAVATHIYHDGYTNRLLEDLDFYEIERWKHLGGGEPPVG